MHTLDTLIRTTGIEVDDHLDRDALVPVLTGLQFQGDVAIVPTRASATPSAPVPAEGIAVVRGENGGNTHLLLGLGEIMFAAHKASDARDLVLGTVTVTEGATAYLAHPEHGYVGIGAGCYTIKRQREQADEIRRVAD